MHVLVTGATGFVGSELARALLLDRGITKVTLLVRPAAGLPPEERLKKLSSYWQRYVPCPDSNALAKVQLLAHDLTSDRIPELPSDTDFIIHSAAATDLDQTLAEARRINLYATQKMLLAARGLKNLRRFVHFSTAYVAGQRSGLIRESDALPEHFHNHYERVKAEAEAAVRASSLPFTVLRPSIVIGRSDNGYVLRMKVLYSVWRIWLAGVIPRAPLDPKSWVDIIPVDFVVAATLKLMRSPEALGATLHLCAGEDRQSPATLMRCAARVFAVPLPPLSPPWLVRALRLPIIRPFLAHGLREALDRMHWQVPYIGMRGRLFDMTRTDALLGSVGCPKFSEYGDVIFKFCRDTAWGKKPFPPSADSFKLAAGS